MLFEVFRLQVPSWTDDFAEALLSIGTVAATSIRAERNVGNQ